MRRTKKVRRTAPAQRRTILLKEGRLAALAPGMLYCVASFFPAFEIFLRLPVKIFNQD